MHTRRLAGVTPDFPIQNKPKPNIAVKTKPAPLTKPRVLSWILALLVLGNGIASAQIFAGGNGTQAAPYQVANAEHLHAVADHPSAHFIQTADIDLDIAPWNEGAGWSPIGSEANPFTGMYDGAGHTVEGLFIDRPNSDHQGLFGFVSGEQARISNLTVEDFSITARNRNGGLVG